MANPLTIVSKLLGAAGAAAVLYEANVVGVTKSKKAQIVSVSDRLPDQYVASTKLDIESPITAKIKEKTFEWQLDWNLPEFLSGIKGYFEGAIESLSNNIIPAALATGALVFGGLLGRGSGKSLAKLCALGLAAVGVKRLLYDTWGIGREKSLGSSLK